MRFVRLILVFAIAMFAVAVSEAQPRPTTAGAPTPLAVVVLNGIDDPVVVADLKLKDEQVKSLVARRAELWDEAYITAPTKLAEGAADRTAATDALLKKTLTEAQYQRAAQLGAQAVLRGSRFGAAPDADPTFRLSSATTAALNRYPELAAAFKLTDEQKKQLTAASDFTGPPVARSIAMTKDQADSAKQFLGPIAKAWPTKTDPRIAAAPTVPNGFYLLEAKDVRAELKLAETEAKTLADLAEKWQTLATSRRFDVSPKDADAQAAVLKAESEKALAALPPEAATRLKQITFQTNASSFGGGFGGGRPVVGDLHIDRLYTNATVVKEVAVTEEQTKAFKALWESFEKDAAAVLSAAEASAAAEKKLNDLVAARHAKAEAILAADQAAKLTALVGKPFTGSTRPDRIGGIGGIGATGPTLALDAARAAQFGKYTTEFAVLASNKSVQEELKLTPEQLKKVAETQTEIQSKYRIAIPREEDGERYAKAYTERSKFVEEALGKLLTEDQAKRFRQLMLQNRERGPDRNSFAASAAIKSAVMYPGVAETVKLTDDQKKKLFAGTAPADVLTADQKSALKEMLGAPFKGDFTTATSGFPTDNPYARSPADARRYATFGNHTNELIELAVNKAVQDELKLTPEQIKKATELRDEIAKITLPSLGPPTVEDYAKAFAERSKAVGEAVAKVLDKDQAKRFREIMMRFRDLPSRTPLAVSGVASTVAYPGAAEAVKLTDDQRVKLITGGAPVDVLTDDQKAALAKMLGEPFKGEPIATGTVIGPGPRPIGQPDQTFTLVRLVSLNKQNFGEALKLTPEQEKKIDAAWTAYLTALEAIPPATGPGQAGALNQQRVAARADFDKAVQALLTADQQKRLAQLVVQANAASSLVAALTAPETAKQLALTKEQTDALTALGEEAVKLQELRTTHVSSDARELKLGLQMRDAADERMMAVLSADQKKKWKELTGDPLPGLTKTVPNRFGGFGVGGGFGPVGP